jgi:hypothetical protein
MVLARRRAKSGAALGRKFSNKKSDSKKEKRQDDLALFYLKI